MLRAREEKHKSARSGFKRISEKAAWVAGIARKCDEEGMVGHWIMRAVSSRSLRG